MDKVSGTEQRGHRERSLTSNQKDVIMKVIRSDHLAFVYNGALKTSFHRPKAQEMDGLQCDQ